MPKTIQLSLLETPKCPDNADDWTFNGAATRELTHCYHDYPARMIPQIAGKLLDQFGSQAQTVFDPYSGSGTSLVESNIRGMNAIGTDLNPLARLIATAKTTILNLPLVENYLSLVKPMRIDQQPACVPRTFLNSARFAIWGELALRLRMVRGTHLRWLITSQTPTKHSTQCFWLSIGNQ